MSPCCHAFGPAGQHITDSDGNRQTLVRLKDIPALGYETFCRRRYTSAGRRARRQWPPRHSEALENSFFQVAFDENGEISSIYDKRTGREVIDESSYCKGNALLAFEDKPMSYDAWDVDIYYLDKVYPVHALVSIEVVEQGPLRASVEIKRSFGVGSSVTQRTASGEICRGSTSSPRSTGRSGRRLLKAAFPVTVHSPTRHLRYPVGQRRASHALEHELGLGALRDLRAEVDGSIEGDYGVSLLSDSKYG